MRRRNPLGFVIAICLATFGVAYASGPPPVHVLLDVSYAPDAGDFALKTSPLILDWYPRINATLYGADHLLPFNLVIVAFQHGQDHAGITTGNVIHISADVLRNRQ